MGLDFETVYAHDTFISFFPPNVAHHISWSQKTELFYSAKLIAPHESHCSLVHSEL